MAKVEVETPCGKCRKPLPTKRVVEKRLSRTLKYPILDEDKVINVQGRWRHKECA